MLSAQVYSMTSLFVIRALFHFRVNLLVSQFNRIGVARLWPNPRFREHIVLKHSYLVPQLLRNFLGKHPILNFGLFLQLNFSRVTFTPCLIFKPGSFDITQKCLLLPLSFSLIDDLIVLDLSAFLRSLLGLHAIYEPQVLEPFDIECPLDLFELPVAPIAHFYGRVQKCWVLHLFLQLHVRRQMRIHPLDRRRHLAH